MTATGKGTSLPLIIFVNNGLGSDNVLTEDTRDALFFCADVYAFVRFRKFRRGAQNRQSEAYLARRITVTWRRDATHLRQRHILGRVSLRLRTCPLLCVTRSEPAGSGNHIVYTYTYIYSGPVKHSCWISEVNRYVPGRCIFQQLCRMCQTRNRHNRCGIWSAGFSKVAKTKL